MIMRYLKGVIEQPMVVKRSSKFGLDIIVDANFCGTKEESQSPYHSRSGIVIKLGGNVIVCKSSIQRYVTRSTAEAEFVAIGDALAITEGIVNLLDEMNIQVNYISLFSDSKSALVIAESNTVGSKLEISSTLRKL